MPKHVSEALRFQKRPNRKHDRGNGKRFGKSFKEKNKGYSKGKKVNCFNRGRMGHVSSNSLSPKGIKKSMQTI